MWIGIAILKLHAITKQLEICIDINIEISISFLQKAYELLSQSKKLNKRRVYKESDRVGEFFEKKISGGGMLIRDPRVLTCLAITEFTITYYSPFAN